MRKNPWTYFFVNFVFEKYLFWKNFRFLGPFFGGGDNSGEGKFFLLFSSHFERLLLQLQTLQVSEGVLGQKYFLNRPWSQKNLMSSWGGAPLQHPLHVFCSLARAHPCYNVFLYFSLHTHLNPLYNISLQLKKKISPISGKISFFLQKNGHTKFVHFGDR